MARVTQLVMRVRPIFRSRYDRRWMLPKSSTYRLTFILVARKNLPGVRDDDRPWKSKRVGRAKRDW